MNVGFLESMSDGLDRLPSEPRHTRPDQCTENTARQSVSQPSIDPSQIPYSDICRAPHVRTRMVHGLFNVGTSLHSPGCSKNALNLVGIPLKKRQAINLAPPESTSGGFDRLLPEPRHTQSNPCIEEHGHGHRNIKTCSIVTWRHKSSQQG